MDNILGYVSPYQRISLEKELLEMDDNGSEDLTPYEFWKALVDYEENTLEEDEESFDKELEDEDIVETSYEYWKRYLLGEVRESRPTSTSTAPN